MPVQLERTVFLSEGGSTRATLYAMSNKIVTIGGKTHVSWLDWLADTMIVTYDHDTGEITEPVLIGSGVDNHAGPAMCADSEGYLYVVFGPHHGPFQFARSARPNDASEWEALPEFGLKATYPSLVCDSEDTLHIAYRGGDVPCRVMYQRRPADGEWTEPRELVSAAVPDGYTQFGNALTVAADGSLHLAFHIYDFHPKGGKAHGHMLSRDGGESWMLMDGTTVELPVRQDQPELLVQASGDLDVRASNPVCDDQSRPYYMTTQYRPENDTLLWSWREDGWQSKPLRPIVAESVDFSPSFVQGVTCSWSDGRLYLAVACGTSPSWGNPTNEVFLLTSDDYGETFAVQQLSETDPDLPNWGPSLERPVGHNSFDVPMLIWTHGERGSGVADETTTEVILGILGE
jgi:hypothetical protein